MITLIISYRERLPVLLPELDKHECQKEARQILKQYRRYSRMAGQPLSNLKSPVVTDMPRSSSYGNLTEEGYIKRINANAELAKLLAAIYSLGQISFESIYYTYMTLDKHADYAIASEMGMAANTFKNYRNQALIEFLEAYEHGKHLIYRPEEFLTDF